MNPLWLLVIALVAAIVAMEAFQARAMRSLGATPPRWILVLRVFNLAILAAVLAYAAWSVISRGR